MEEPADVSIARSGETLRQMIKVYSEAAAANGRDAEAWLTLGAAYDAAGNNGQARTAYRSCVTRGSGPRVAECRQLLGE